nr:hypothetical protein [uncultured Chitinophaga sp.]
MKNKSFSLFFKKAFILIVILFVADYAVGKIMERFFLQIKAGETGRGLYAFNQTKEDIIVVGSSRANHHYVSKILEDSLKMSCYNAGRDGQGILYHTALLKAIATRKPPKLVIFDFNPSEFVEGGFDRIALLSPYYGLHPEIQSILNLRGPFEQIKQCSGAYRYNSLMLTILANNLIKREETSIAGYMPLFGQTKDSLSEYPVSELSQPIDTLKVNLFENLVTELQASNTKLVVCVSPIYLKIGDSSTPSINIGKEICQRYKIPFLDDSQMGTFLNDRAWFTDSRHLNDKGAHKFSEIFLQQLNTGLQEYFQGAVIPTKKPDVQ